MHSVTSLDAPAPDFLHCPPAPGPRRDVLGPSGRFQEQKRLDIHLFSSSDALIFAKITVPHKSVDAPLHTPLEKSPLWARNPRLMHKLKLLQSAIDCFRLSCAEGAFQNATLICGMPKTCCQSAFVPLSILTFPCECSNLHDNQKFSCCFASVVVQPFADSIAVMNTW